MPRPGTVSLFLLPLLLTWPFPSRAKFPRRRNREPGDRAVRTLAARTHEDGPGSTMRAGSRSPCSVEPVSTVRPGDGPQLAVPSPPPITWRLVPGRGVLVAREITSGRLRCRLRGRRVLPNGPGRSRRLHAGTAEVARGAVLFQSLPVPGEKNGLRGRRATAVTTASGLARRRNCSGT